MVQIQAMACGLPLICTKYSGGEDLVDEGINGFVLPIRDKEGLKEKLNFLYKNKDILISMSKKAEEKARSFYKWEDYGDKIIKFYSSILK